MPRYSINLLLYYNTNIKWAYTNVSYKIIIIRLKDLWKSDVNARIIERRLREWNIQARTQIADTPFLCAQIIILYYLGDIDKEILEDLENYGYIALITGVVHIYKKLSLIHRITIMDRQAADK
jgi:hypothetical protein